MSEEKKIKVLIPENIEEVHLETPEHVLFFLIFRAIEEQTRLLERQGKEKIEAIRSLTKTIEQKKGK